MNQQGDPSFMGPGGNPQANMVPGRMAGPPQATMMQGMQGNPQGGPMYQSGDMKGWPQGAMQRSRYMHRRKSQNTPSSGNCHYIGVYVCWLLLYSLVLNWFSGFELV